MYEGDNPCRPGLACNLTELSLYIKCLIELHKDPEMVNTYVQVHLTALYIKATIRYHISPEEWVKWKDLTDYSVKSLSGNSSPVLLGMNRSGACGEMVHRIY